MPHASILEELEQLSVRSWVFGQVVGLDVAGRAKDGAFVRWVGAPLAAAIEYKATTGEAAAAFDRMIATMCKQSVISH